MDELKPCPFCGGIPYIWKPPYSSWWEIECENCSTLGYVILIRDRDREKATQIWNTRKGE